MLRFIFALVAAVALLAVATRARPVWRALWILLALVALYAALKLTGVIDALAPARDGWQPRF